MQLRCFVCIKFNMLEIADLHNDFLTSNAVCNDDVASFINYAVWSTYLSEAETFSKADSKNVQTDGIYSIEDCSNINDFDAAFFKGFEIFSLTWNFDNSLGGGAFGQNIPLTNKGKKVIKTLNAHLKITDVSHCSYKTFYDIIDISERVIATHSCVYSLNSHKRNLKDEQINEIIERKGLIGITLVSEFLTSNDYATSDDVLRHIDYIVQKWGVDYVGIGSDFFGTDKLPVDIKNYKNYDIIVEKLLKIGYNDSDIEKIFYNNFINYIGVNRNERYLR